MTKDGYINNVMIRFNELGWDDSGGFFGGNTTRVSEQIESTFVDAWRLSVDIVPHVYHNQSSFKLSRHIKDISSGTGYIELPADFYVLSCFKMKCWKRSCFSAPEEDDKMAALQSNEVARGNFCKPVCTLSRDDKGVQILKYYSIPRGMDHIIEKATYIPLINSIDDTPTLDSRLLEPLMWLHLSIIISIFEKPELADLALKKASSLIG